MQSPWLLENSYKVLVNVATRTDLELSQVNLVTLTKISMNFPNYHDNCIFMRVSTFGKSYIGCNISHMKYNYMGVTCYSLY